MPVITGLIEKKRRSELAKIREVYRERTSNFKALKDGLIEDYVISEKKLRDRQQKSVFKLTDVRDDDYSLSTGYFEACTGFGKTYLMIAIAEGYKTAKTDKKTVIFEESTQVLEQVRQDFMDKSSFDENDIGAFYGDEKNIDAPVIVCTYASMKKMIKAVGKQNIGLVLCDEAHHILSENRQQVAQEFNGCCLYGFTATPDYNESKNCAQVFGKVIDSINLRQGVEEGLLCSVKNGLMISRIPVDLTDCKSYSGDYDDQKMLAAIEKASHKKGIRESIAEYYLNASDTDLGKIYGKTALINVPNQNEADRVAETFNEMAGHIIAKAYHTNSGDIPLKEFNEGKFPVLVQVNKLSEGYNNPKIELCINYPTASLVRETQCSGRALRIDIDNPHKMALVLDIVFKKENGSDVYEEIAKNGQVLFKDVAGDVFVLTPEYRRLALSEQRKAKEDGKTLITNDMLFDVITSYEDLFKLALEHEEHLEEEFIPYKKDNDIKSRDFTDNYKVRSLDGMVLSVDDKKKLYKILIADEKLRAAGIVAKRRTSTGQVFSYIIGDKIEEFNQISGYIIEDREILLDRKSNDISADDFINRCDVYDKDGRRLLHNEKCKIFDELVEREDLQQVGLVGKRKSGLNVTSYIIGDKLTELCQILGYKITDKEKFMKKKENDIGLTDFLYKYDVYDKNGRKLTQNEKNICFNELIKRQDLQQLELIGTRQAGVAIFSCIIGDRLDEFNQVSGYRVLDKEQIFEKKDNDIGFHDFTRKYDIYNVNRLIVKREEKEQIFRKIVENQYLWQLGLIAKRRMLAKISVCIIGDKISEFNQVSGYRILDKETILTKKDNDIGSEDFVRKYSVYSQDGHLLTQAEKYKVFQELCQNEALLQSGLLGKRQSSSSINHCIIGDRLDEFNQVSGYRIANKEQLVEKKDNDIGAEDFVRKYSVYSQDGHLLTQAERYKAFKELFERQDLLSLGLVGKRRFVSTPANFIIGDKLDEFNRVSGYKIADKEQIFEKKNNDIGCNDFIQIYDIYDKDGRKLTQTERREIFKEFVKCQEFWKRGLIEKRKSGVITAPCIIGDKLDEFNQISGYTIITPFERLHEIQEKATQAETPTERNKYLTQAKKLFEVLYPEIKKQNVCVECLKKIHSGKKLI